MTILKPSAAGRFYPGDPAALRHQVERYLDEAETSAGGPPVLSVLVPHAGYPFSGPVAAHAFKRAMGEDPDTVLFLALSHQGVEGGRVFPGEGFETPLGVVENDMELANALTDGGEPLLPAAEPYRREHSVEVNLPFAQTVFPRAKVAAVLITRTDAGLAKTLGEKIAAAIRRFPGKRVLICVSSDLSHYPPYEDAVRIDRSTLEALESLDTARILSAFDHLLDPRVENLHCVMCGSGAMLTAVETCKRLGAEGAQTLCYRNSGDSPAGGRGRVVGYGAMAIFGNGGKDRPKAAEERNPYNVGSKPLSAGARRELLSMARSALDGALRGGFVEITARNPELDQKSGLFVTLKNRGQLRGCLGRFPPVNAPLGELAPKLAVDAALRDHRFARIVPEELPDVDITISRLTEPRTIDDIREIQIGRHGLKIIYHGGPGGVRSGTLLPQVAVERHWTAEEFLEQTCIKTGLAPAAWRDAAAEVQVYEAEIFGDLDFGTPPFAVAEGAEIECERKL